jgi:hypothetical protein
MQTLLIVLIGLHILAGVFWAGSTFTIARFGGAGAQALFGAQMGAATLTVLAGIGLWGILHQGAMGPMEHTLALGSLCAIIAAGVQGATRKKNPLKGQRIAAGLLAVAVICMAIARFVGF